MVIKINNKDDYIMNMRSCNRHYTVESIIHCIMLPIKSNQNNTSILTIAQGHNLVSSMHMYLNKASWWRYQLLDSIITSTIEWRKIHNDSVLEVCVVLRKRSSYSYNTLIDFAFPY